MNKKHFLVLMITATALVAAALYTQTTGSPSAPSTPPASPVLSLGVKAYTSSRATDYGNDCFQQEGASKKTLYFKAYASFPVKKATLELYHYGADGSRKGINPTVKYYYYQNTVKIQVTDSSPPHLGPGPYEAVITASDSVSPAGDAAGQTAMTSHYYDTYQNSYQECWQH